MDKQNIDSDEILDINTNLISSDSIKNFIDFLKTGQKLSVEDLLAVNEMNAKQQDLLHDLEIPDKLYVKDITFLGKELRTLRRNRRKIKDELLLADAISSFVKNHPNIISELEELRLSIVDKESFLSNRTYKVKSTLISTTAMENKKLKSDDNKIMMTINKILKKWSNNNHEAVLKDCQSDIPGGIHHIIDFKMTNMSYDYYAAKSAYSNFKLLMEKDLKTIFPDSELIKFSMSNMCLNDQSNRTSTLLCTYDFKIDNETIYTLNGSITFKLYSPRPKYGKPKNKKKKR